MKTRDRILAGALALFNEHGFGPLSALDIATALGISPGHLYYHFKGKNEIAASLLEGYERELALVLKAALNDCTGKGATIETFWTHLTIMVEEAWDARFFYREAGPFLQHPAIASRVRRITTAERSAIARMLAALAASGAIRATEEIVDGLSRTLVTGLGFQILELQLEGDSQPARALIARAAAQLMLPVAALARDLS